MCAAAGAALSPHPRIACAHLQKAEAVHADRWCHRKMTGGLTGFHK